MAFSAALPSPSRPERMTATARCQTVSASEQRKMLIVLGQPGASHEVPSSRRLWMSIPLQVDTLLRRSEVRTFCWVDTHNDHVEIPARNKFDHLQRAGPTVVDYWE